MPYCILNRKWYEELLSHLQGMENHDHILRSCLYYKGAHLGIGSLPEPATMLLFGFGLLGLAGISRRKK